MKEGRKEGKSGQTDRKNGNDRYDNRKRKAGY